MTGRYQAKKRVGQTRRQRQASRAAKYWRPSYEGEDRHADSRDLEREKKRSGMVVGSRSVFTIEREVGKRA